MSRSQRRVSLMAIGIAALCASSFALPAFGAPSAPEADEPGLVAWDGPLPEGIELTDGKPVPGEMPESTSDAIWNLEIAGIGSAVNTYEWASDTESLIIYSARGDDFWAPVLKQYLPNQKVQLVKAANSKASVDAVMGSIVESGGQLSNGDRIVTAIPAKDGSSITLGLESASDVKSLSSRSVASTLQTSIPLVIEEAPEVEAATRNASGASPQWLGGNFMRTNAASGTGYYSCTTGFRIGNLSTSAPGMLSAEHCGRDKPFTAWQYSSVNNPTQNHIGDFQGFLSTAGFNSDTALWTGGRLAQMIPAIYTGSYTDVSTGEFIRGGNYPAVGTDVCYSGSRSGNVCSNEVLFTGLTICYSVTQCYAGLSWTSQRSSIEAAGNGDSGGPVYQMVSGKAMASGVISGIVGGSSTCTGDPGTSTRSCSPVALFAPVVAALGSGGSWGLSYIP